MHFLSKKNLEEKNQVELYYLVCVIFFIDILIVYHLQMKQKMQKEAELLKRRSMDVEKQLLQFQQHSKQEKVFIKIIVAEIRTIRICYM